MMIRSVRIFSFVAIGLAAALAHGQDTAQKVTFSAKAGSAKQVLEGLSKQTGVTFATSPQTADEVLLVDVKDVPLTDLMKQLAKAAAAEWQSEGEGFRLVRSQALHNQQEREYYDARAANVRKEQEALLKAYQETKPITPAEAAKIAELQRRQMEQISTAVSEGRPISGTSIDRSALNANPTTRLLLRLLTSFTPADLARIPQGARVVYSTAPTRVQRPLPGAASRAIADFAREAEIWLNAMPPQGPSADPTRQIFIGVPGGNMTRMEGGIGKVLLVVQRMPFMDGLQTELRVADRAGNIASNAMRMLRLGASPQVQTIRGGEVPAGNPAPTPEPAQAGKPLEITKAAQEHAAFMMQSPNRNNISFVAAPSTGASSTRSIAITSTAFEVGTASGGGAPPRVSMTPQWQPTFLKPEQNDPLSFAVSELFQSLAKVRGRNLVASLPDSALISLSQRAQQRITDQQLLEIAKNSLEIEVEDTDGFLNVRPQSPFYARSVRVDRVELGRLLSSIQKEGRLTLDTLCRYALSRTNPAPNPSFDGRYVAALFPNDAGDFNAATSNWRMHQLYATMTADQRRTLANGGRLNLGGLSTRQAGIVNSMIYDDMQGPIYIDPKEAQQPQRLEQRSMVFAGDNGMMFAMGGSNNLMSERTEFLPIGIPNTGTLALQVTTQESALASRKDGTVDPRYFTAESYGVYQGIAPNIVLAGNSGGYNAMPTYDTFRPAVQQTLDFLFQFTPQSSLAKQLSDAWFVPGSTAGAYGLLPEIFRKKAEAEAARMKDSRATINLGGAPGRVRPPMP